MTTVLNRLRKRLVHRPAEGLLLCGLFSLAIYIAAFVLPYNLFPLARRGSPADLGLITDYSWVASLLYMASISALFGLYGVAIGFAGRLWGGQGRWVIIGCGMASAVALCLVYPFGAADVFVYIVRGRVLGIYGQNSLRVPPSTFPTQPYLPFESSWADVPSNYGPLWEWAAAGMARLGDGSLLRSLLAFKALGFLAYVASLGVMLAILQLKEAERAPQRLVALAWNPLILIESHAMAHNDLWMAFFVLLACWFWESKRYAGAIVALALGGLVKHIPFILLPPTLLLMWHRLPWRAWWRHATAGLAIAALLVALLFAPLWPGWEAFDLVQQMNRVYFSVGAWVIVLLSAFVNEWTAFDVGLWLGRILFVVGYGWGLWQAWRRDGGLAEVYHRALYVVLISITMAFGYWYIIWLAALFPLVARREVWLRTIIFGWCGLMSVAIYTFISAWTRGALDTRQVHLVAVPLVFGLPYLLGRWLDAKLPDGQREF